MPDKSVKFFTSVMSGAPQSNGDAGTFVAILDACLVNGFGTVTLDSVVVSNNVATCTKSAGHGFAMTGGIGPVIAIAGATPDALNGEWRIASVPSNTVFTFTTVGISNQTATGTITAKRAPAGWTKPFSGTNKAAYRSASPQSTGCYLRFDDSMASGTDLNCSLTMYESMSDIDTGSGAGTALGMRRRTGTYNFTRTWKVYADSRAFYLLVNTMSANNGYGGSGHCFFGDLARPAAAADAWYCALATGGANVSEGMPVIDNETNGRFARSYNQIDKNVAMRRRSHRANPTYVGIGGGAYVPEIGMLVHQVEAWQGASYYRGLMPGWYGLVHPATFTWAEDYYQHLEIGTMAGYLMYTAGTDTPQMFDISGPWR